MSDITLAALYLTGAVFLAAIDFLLLYAMWQAVRLFLNLRAQDRENAEARRARIRRRMGGGPGAV